MKEGFTMMDLATVLMTRWLWDLIPDPPVETKRTELPFRLNTSINLMAIPITVLLILGLVFRRW